MATPSTETAAEKARQVADTRHPLYKGAAAAAASRTPEHHRDEQVAPPASPSDPPAAADGTGISHDIYVRQQAKCAAVAPAAIPASEHRRDEQAAPPGLPRDQPAATRNDTDILREATRSPENDRGGQLTPLRTISRTSPQQHPLPVMLPTAAALPAQVWRLAVTVLRTRMQKMLDGIQTQGIPWTRPLLLLRAQQPPVRQNIPVTSKPQSQRHQVTSLLQRTRMVQVFQHDTDVGQQATSSSNDRDRQIDTTTDDLEDKPAATSPSPSGDALGHSDAASTGAVSSRNSARFVPLGQQVKVSPSNDRGTQIDTAPNDPDPSAAWRPEEHRFPPLAPEQEVGT